MGFIPMNFQEAVSYIEETPKFTSKNKAENTTELLARLGHPEEGMKIVHVAGTNGKGSVCAFLAQILSDSGRRTGLFTSPHLTDITDRFQICSAGTGRENIDRKSFTDAFGTVMEQVESMMKEGWFHPTYFELLFAIGMVIFSRQKVEWLVMETGLGGRLDATNTVRHPALCVITSISLDHTQYLGSTIPEIAAEKAGIIKPGIPVVYDASDREAAEVVAKTAAQVGAAAYPWYPGMSRIVERSAGSVTYVLNNRWFDYLTVRVPFPADYQVANSSLALMAAKLLDPAGQLTKKEMAASIARTRWSGRMEEILPGVILDGAHNPGAIRQFTGTVRRIGQDKKVSLLFTVVSDKDYEQMIRQLAQEAGFEAVTVTQAGGKRQIDAPVLKQIFEKYTDVPVKAIRDPQEAFWSALSERPAGGVLFCAGSLYLAAEIKKTVEKRQRNSSYTS